MMIFCIYVFLLFIFLTFCDCVCDAFQAQQSNLVQVARSLGRAVPLSPQLIFTPTATVTAVQSESSTQASSQVDSSHKILSLKEKYEYKYKFKFRGDHNLEDLEKVVAVTGNPVHLYCCDITSILLIVFVGLH